MMSHRDNSIENGLKTNSNTEVPKRISFCIKCFNQEDYIEAALRGALEQQHSHMEIIVADDASTDRSLAVICNTIASYPGYTEISREDRESMRLHSFLCNGHSIVLMQNRRNLGNIGNWQAICAIATGDILVKADGDDISMPNRVRVVSREWGPEFCLVHGAETIDLKGRPKGFFLKADGCHGAASAYDRRCYTDFGPIEYEHAADDEVYLWRAKILGGHKIITNRLVKYRIGSGFSSITGNFRERMSENYSRTFASRSQTKCDLEYAKQKISTLRYQELNEALESSRIEVEAETILWSNAPMRDRINAYARLQRSDPLSKRGIMNRLQLLPRPISDVATNLIAAIGRVIRLRRSSATALGDG